ncbi:histidine phosphatase family protein [Paenibacillus spongiae]|uniref:Histidine phosphatase family protein n=1 Tax=Paenibacillus spongiae TaxID=2909671 RepID=A0ABY5S701_9BACL|nr:histidine phosphatase family protein [Paenibacillus spongiae]UVI29444.1 histidine phosphatase family protein [Paenibacillus spongiae]
MKTVIYMVRHAESPYVHGEERTRGLSEAGHREAKRAAEALREMEIHYVASSPYARAVQTVQDIASDRSLSVDEYEDLKERSIKGENETDSWEVLEEAIRRSFEDKDYALDGGESTLQVQRRSVPVIGKLLDEHQGENIVIGTHGNIMTIIMNHYDERYGYEFWRQTSKPDIYKLVFDGQRLEAVERIWH